MRGQLGCVLQAGSAAQQQHSSSTAAVPYLGPITLCDLLGCGVELALQLAALLPVSKHLHPVGTKLGTTQVDSKEVALLCNTSGHPSLGMAKKRGSGALLMATAQGPPSPQSQALLPHHGRSLSCGPGASERVRNFKQGYQVTPFSLLCNS